MVKVYSIDGVTPVVHPSAYVHPSAVLIGDVIVGPDCYIGPGACLRGDFGRLLVERGANIQDCCIMHGFPERDTIVGENGHIGHGAVLHCCRIGRNALVGMNAVVMDKAEVGESAIVAAMAFVKAGMVVPPRTLVAGIPAKVVRELTEQEMAWKVEGTVLYQQLARRSAATMRETVALTEVETERPRIVLRDIKPLIEAKAEWAEADAQEKP
ncbi:MAG: phenylacetic acid degradation protein PaaY [Rhodocyclales bacterium]|nr:phenylacetic acid degradation protein PaaY [Rhodocyclales bacterium]